MQNAPEPDSRDKNQGEKSPLKGITKRTYQLRMNKGFFNST
jgi:hypothetical protein